MSEQSEAATDDRSERPPGMPRWVKATIVVIGVLVALFVILKIAGVGGEYGPGRHMSSAPASEGQPVAQLLATSSLP